MDEGSVTSKRENQIQTRGTGLVPFLHPDMGSGWALLKPLALLIERMLDAGSRGSSPCVHKPTSSPDHLHCFSAACKTRTFILSYLENLSPEKEDST